MEIAAFKVKSRNLPVLIFGHSNLNIWSYRSPIDANSIVLDFRLKDLSTLQVSSKKDVILGRYDFSKITTKFCQQTGLVKKRVQITFRSIKPTSKFYFSNLAPLSQSLNISCKVVSPFLGK